MMVAGTTFFARRIYAKFTADKPLRLGIQNHARDCARLRAAAYRNRHYATIQKIELDIVRSKLAEWAVHHWLKTIRPNVSQPDMNLYTDAQMAELKHAPDLVNDTDRFGVKSCKMSDKDPSWVFQKSDPLHDNVYFFCRVDEECGHGIARLSWMVTPDIIKDLAAPLRNKAPSKFAVYEKHLLVSKS